MNTMQNATERKGMKWASLIGLAVIGASTILGGCNSELKKENEALRDENVILKEKTNTCDARVTAAESQLGNLQRANTDLQQQLSSKSQQQAVTLPPANPGYGNELSPAPQPRNRGGSNSRGGETFRVSGDVLFASGQATIKNEAKKELDSIASQIKNNYAGRNIRIEGYTDSDPLTKTKAKWGNNQQLSQARADAVRDYLAKKGISRNSIDTVGKGSANPLGSKAASRRVEIVVVD